MVHIRSIAHVLLIIAPLYVVGCARQPSASRTSAPQPAGVPPAATLEPAPATSDAAGAQHAEGERAEGAGEARVEPAPPTATAARPNPKEFAPTARLRDIYFEFDSYMIEPDQERKLGANADWLLSNPGYLVLIEGHADERGTNEYNVVLGEQRARATLDYLMAHGVSPDRITTLSYGEERPFCTARSEACWAENRRAHFLVKRAGGPTERQN
jgi:peptidoglycan-associated lipoprotein